ncbi:hypothetical protein JM16_009127 [Phytophthora kernoviae]|uniref:Cwf18 pre-mRNA splicing factor n=1 Tax=Phytophthora kernoviae TaxID=325452 RepID=A0A8T0LJ22_9STRA|nr:hypothetical protein JM16_009127 [Phytophthora kernoviae]
MVDADEPMPRAKRLKLLREAKLRKECGESGVNDTIIASLEVSKPIEDESMQEKKQQEDKDTNQADDKAEGLVEKVAQIEEGVNTEDESEDELLNLAPKRANWDMERDIAPMLRKLERRTQHAIVEILREKMAAEQEEEEDDDDDGDEEEEEEE